jgi:hypothetical protein
VLGADVRHHALAAAQPPDRPERQEQ